MEELKFDSKPEYLDFLEGLIGRDISEIVRLDNYDYNFKIDNTWFNLKNQTIVGTNFSDGPCVIIESGKNLDDMVRLYIRQFKWSERVEKIFQKLNDSYIKYLVISNDKSKELVRSLIEFLNRCDYIEKYSSNLFIITKEKSKFVFLRSEDFTNGLFQIQLKVKQIIGDKEKLIDSINDDFSIKSIFSFLEFAYYSSRIKDISKIQLMIEKELK